MTRETFQNHLRENLAALTEEGLYKQERVLLSPQGGWVEVGAEPPGDGARYLNLCANNYLGLAGDPAPIAAAGQALDRYGFGMASVRFICGTQDQHKDLEAAIAGFLGAEDAILYSSCFDANTGLFETLLGEQDAIISDALNHASVIDGVRLCKARRYRYANNHMGELEARLKEAADARFRLIATDGVFSMDGVIADLPAICDLADKYGAMVMVDDSHAVGVIGETGAGTPEYHGVADRVDIVTGTLGKALGGASGGYTAARREVVDYLRQRSRPYLFSNSLAPPIVAATLAVLKLMRDQPELRRRLEDNSNQFRLGLTRLGFQLAGAGHPIIPVMIGDARLAQEMAAGLLAEGVYVIAFSYPVVPRDQARIRTQMSAAHSGEDVEIALAAFEKVGRRLGLTGDGSWE
ncbi:MAG: glycine C-acetyltransferase [Alphaproteobacteria bacterium]